MKNKKTLNSQFVIWDYFPVLQSLVDYDKVKLNALKNYWGNYRQSYDIDDWRYNYFNLSDDKNISWIIDYIRDSYNLISTKNTLRPNSRRCMVLSQNESINSHNHIDPYDLLNSPIMSGIFTSQIGKNEVNLVIEYETGRLKSQKMRIPMETNKIILFNSELNHYYEANNNKEPLINICFSFSK
jgi:hypothetical protein